MAEDRAFLLPMSSMTPPIRKPGCRRNFVTCSGRDYPAARMPMLLPSTCAVADTAGHHARDDSRSDCGVAQIIDGSRFG